METPNEIAIRLGYPNNSPMAGLIEKIFAAKDALHKNIALWGKGTESGAVALARIDLDMVVEALSNPEQTKFFNAEQCHARRTAWEEMGRVKV